MNPSGERAARRLLVGLDVRAEHVQAPGRGGVEHVELGPGREQRLQRLALAVVEGRQDGRQAALVARRRPRRVLGDERAHALRIALLDRREELLHGSDATAQGRAAPRGRRPGQRSSPQTSSVTSFVNAASARKDFGLSREVSANETVPASMRAV